MGPIGKADWTTSRHLLHRADERLQSVLFVGDHDSTPDGDGGGEDGLLHGGVKVHCRR